MRHTLRSLIFTALFLTSSFRLVADCVEENSFLDCFQGDFLLDGELLYWRAFQDGLTSGCENEIKDNLWDLGYRLKLGYIFLNGWDLQGEWTRFHAAVTGDNGKADYSFWQIHYDTADLNIGYDYCMGSCISLRPYLGFRCSWIKQIVVSHLVTERTCSGGDAIVIMDQNDTEKFSGMGPRLGLMAEWQLRGGFSVFANLAGGFQYGRFRLRTIDTETYSNPTDSCTCDGLHHPQACEAVTDASIGIRWQYCLGGYLMGLQAAAESHHYFGHTHIGETGDLSLDGFAFSANLQF